MKLRATRRLRTLGALPLVLAGAALLAAPAGAAIISAPFGSSAPFGGGGGPWRPTHWPPQSGGGGGTPNPVKTVLATGLEQPKQIAEGPDGSLYVTCSGNATGASPVLGRFPGNQSGSVVKVSPTSGTVTPYLSGLRSNFYEGSAVGPSGLAFWNGSLYVAQALQDAVNAPTGQMLSAPVLKVLPSGEARVFTSFNALPNDPFVAGEIDTNPYSAAVGNDGRLYVGDGGENGVWRVDANGDYGLFVQFPGDPVVTGIAAPPRGGRDTLAVALFGNGVSGFSNGKVVEVTGKGSRDLVPQGVITMPIGVAYSPQGNLYVLQFATPAPRGIPGPPFSAGTGAVWSVNASGAATKLVSGLNFPTGITFSRDGTAYVTNNGLMPGSGPVTGEVVKITGLP